MSSRVTLSPEERSSLMREAHNADHGDQVPVKTVSKKSPRFAKSGKSGRGREGGIKPPKNRRPSGGGRSKGGKKIKRIILVFLALLILVGGLFSAKMLQVGRSVLNPDRSVLAQLSDFLFRGNSQLLGEKEGQINILLLAIGGEGHKGENLADTIMVAMLRPKEKEAALLSIPRDLFVKIPGTNAYSKINAVHAYNENNGHQGGPAALRKKVEDITGLDIHYYARVDFKAFKTIVDKIGGVEITIPNSFYDYWHKISFPAGTELMNGERALAYVRARYVEGPEGGDFRRAARQQQVLMAIGRKVLSANTAFDFRAVSGILDALKENVATSFNLWELKRLSELSREIIAKENIKSTVLSSTGPDDLLVGKTEIVNGKPSSTVVPRKGQGNYEEIRDFVANIYQEADVSPIPSSINNATPTPEPSPSPSPKESSVKEESSTVEIRNGTTVTGLAARTSSALKQKDFKVEQIGNASKQNREETILIDQTDGKKLKSLEVLKNTLGVEKTVQFPESEATSDADFLILLGSDVKDKFSS